MRLGLVDEGVLLSAGVSRGRWLRAPRLSWASWPRGCLASQALPRGLVTPGRIWRGQGLWAALY